jgi:hypothetical protein
MNQRELALLGDSEHGSVATRLRQRRAIQVAITPFDKRSVGIGAVAAINGMQNRGCWPVVLQR